MKRSEVKEGPILQFQSTLFEKEDIKKLLITINTASGVEGLKEDKISELYAVWWPVLREKLNNLKDEVIAESADFNNNTSVANSVGTDDILEEILDLVRSQQKLLSNPDKLIPAGYLLGRISRKGDPLGISGKLIAGIGHDLNNLYAVILGNITYVQSRLIDEMSDERLDIIDQIQGCLRQVERATLASRELAQALLDFSNGKDGGDKKGNDTKSICS
jgi:signal transduction histidine kinase